MEEQKGGMAMLNDTDRTRGEARIAELWNALDRASYALFCVKRLIDAGPETVEHCRKAYEAALKVLDKE